MSGRNLFLADVLAIVNKPTRARLDGVDEFGRTRCLLTGRLIDDAEAQLLAVIEDASPDRHTIFITIYWT